MIENRIEIKKDINYYKLAFKYINIVGVLWLIIWGFKGIKYKGFMKTASGTFHSMIQGFVHPDIPYLQNMTIDGLPYALVETIAIAIAGTFVSAIISIPFALLASQNIVGKSTSKFGKLIITAIRTFPEIILALIFIKIVGPGPAAGVLALGFHSIGMLGKLFSESIESMDYGVAEAAEACGGNYFEILFRAIIPQVSPEFLSYTLYRFEINSRAAAVLGIVGAGGIGAPLNFAIRGREWDRIGIILISLVITVTLIDLISGRIRKKIV